MLVVVKYTKDSAVFETDADAVADLFSAMTPEQKAASDQLDSDAVTNGLITQPASYELVDGNSVVKVFELRRFFKQSELDSVNAREAAFEEAGWIATSREVDGQAFEKNNGRHYVGSVLVPVLPG